MQCPYCHHRNPDDTRFCGRCGKKFPSGDEASVTTTMTLPALPVELAVGGLFAQRYLVLDELGRGGMGRVYRVLDKKLDVEIALKLLKPEIAAEAKTVERFKNELKLARIISHQNVCRMFDFAEERGTHYITMEYIPGEDLKSTVKRVGPLNLNRAIEIAKQVCDGLAAAHRLNVIHRDLKPRNIMLDRTGNVRVMDFGISRSLHAQGITTEGLMIGTPEYMSPEQAEGIAVDARSDIYSLGIVMFEMTTGKVPFDGDTTLSIILKQKLEPPPDPRSLNPQLPKEMSRVILKCLEKSKEKRYQNVEALRRDLEKLETAIKPREKRPVGAPKKRALPWGPVLIVSGIALIAALAIAFLFLGKKQAEKPQEARKSEKTIAAAINPAPPKPTSEKPVLQKRKPAMPYGSLEISSLPDGAQVYINNKLEGVTPLQKQFSAGNYDIRVRKAPGFKEWREVLTVKTGEKITRDYSLVPRYILNIRTIPEGADVYVDGSYKGKSPLNLESANKECIIEIKNGEGWIPHNESIQLSPGNNSIRRTLKRPVYNLSVIANPSPAMVSVGNRPAVTSPANLQVEYGIYPVKVEKQGYQTIQESVTVHADSARTFDLVLLPPGKVRFNVQPYAEVYINDRLVGEVPPVNTQELSEGKYVLRFVASKLNKELTVELEVKSGESQEVRVNMLTAEYRIIKLEK